MEKAKAILFHPNFEKLSSDQIQNIYTLLLETGMTKPQIATILQLKNTTHLEALDYNSFLELIFKGQIVGKDLIALCNSSPLINEKCNRGFNAEGKIIPQYLFYLLLKKDPPKFNVYGDYRQQYLQKIKYEKAHLSLVKKIDILEFDDIKSDVNLYELLYESDADDFDDYAPAFLYNITDENNAYVDFLDTYQFLKVLANQICTNLIKEPWSREYEIEYTKCIVNTRYNVEKLAQLRGKSLDEFMETDFIENSPLNYTHFDDVTLDDFKYNALHITDLFRDELIEFDNKFSEDEIKNAISEQWAWLIKNAFKNTRNNNTIASLNQIRELSNDEINYLYFLHKSLVDGHLEFSMPFKY